MILRTLGWGGYTADIARDEASPLDFLLTSLICHSAMLYFQRNINLHTTPITEKNWVYHLVLSTRQIINCSWIWWMFHKLWSSFAEIAFYPIWQHHLWYMVILKAISFDTNLNQIQSAYSENRSSKTMLLRVMVDLQDILKSRCTLVLSSLMSLLTSTLYCMKYWLKD